MKRSPLLCLVAMMAMGLSGCGNSATAEAKPPAKIINQKSIDGIVLTAIVDGDDWSLPASAMPKANTGFYDSPPELQNEDLRTLILTWKELNPAEGVYDFSRLDFALAQNFRIWLRLYSSDVLHVPQWVLDKYPQAPRMQHDNYEGPTYPDLLGNHSPGLFLAPWYPGVQQEFSKFMTAFAARDFLANEKLAFMYAPGAWRWNEWVTKFTYPMRQQGITPDAYFAWFRQYIDLYVVAAGTHRYKMVFTGYGRVDISEGDAEFGFRLNDMTQGLNLMTDYAARAGLSVRVGDLEYFNQFDAMPAWGSPFITQDGFNYQIIDQAHPLRSDPNRIIASENEAFGDQNMLAGTAEPYYTKMVTLKSLQQRMNWLNVQHFAYESNPDVLQYARKVMGKNAAESPDAWVVLRSFRDEFYAPGNGQAPGMPEVAAFITKAKGEFRNWERYLTQREVTPGGRTFPAMPNTRTTLTDERNGPSFDAIRTDRATGNEFIYFKLDGAFAGKSATPVHLKVTYLDNSGRWMLRYRPQGFGKDLVSPAVIGTATNRWKTADFSLPGMPVGSRYSNDMDFRLHSISGDDLTVSLVRVVK
jgi:hypothetical protein